MFRNSKNKNQAPVEEKQQKVEHYDDNDRWDAEQERENNKPKPQLLKQTIDVETTIIKK